MAASGHIFCLIFLFFRVSAQLESIFDQDGELGDLADAFGELFNEMTDCEYKCPNGVTPKTNPNHVPTTNGCGSYGIKVESDMVPGMTGCCDTHDLCYDTCGFNKKTCDADFKECLTTICDENQKKMSAKQFQGCKSTSKLLYGGTSVLGCDAFLSSQKKACKCASIKGTNNKNEKGTNKKTGNRKRNEL